MHIFRWCYTCAYRFENIYMSINAYRHSVHICIFVWRTDCMCIGMYLLLVCMYVCMYKRLSLFGWIVYQPLMVIQTKFCLYIYIHIYIYIYIYIEWFLREWFVGNFIFKLLRAHLFVQSKMVSSINIYCLHTVKWLREFAI